MRAVLKRRYGGPDRLTIEDVPEPEPGVGEVRVAVAAASLNALDWHLMRADPAIARTMTGLLRPKDPRMGVDMAGTVTAIGPGVTAFAVGDAVFGPASGALAESVIARVKDVLPVPDGVALTDAAALPIAGFTAVQALRDWGSMTPGASVLVHGAAGGVGHLAVQLARGLGASRVDAVTRGSSVDFVAELGPDEVFDHERVDVTRADRRYDLVVDTASTHSLESMQALLRPGGTLVNVGSVSMGRWLGPLSRSRAATRLSRPDALIRGGMATWSRDDLETLATEAAAGRVRARVTQTYPLTQIREAVARLERGGIQGKIVVLPRTDA